jgi:hypothetical protein
MEGERDKADHTPVGELGTLAEERTGAGGGVCGGMEAGRCGGGGGEEERSGGDGGGGGEEGRVGRVREEGEERTERYGNIVCYCGERDE